jgi:predicted aspartyl protease
MFSYVRNTSLVVVPVMVNDHGPFRFLLDTGASNSILAASVADGLRIRSGRQETLFTAGGNIPVTMRTIQLFQVGEARLKNAEIAVADFNLLQTLEIDGILGGDYLRKFKVSIDYEKQVVQIEPLAGSSSMLIA